MTEEFKLKNYTTSVPAERTISEIEQALAKFGASAVMKDFLSDGRCASLAFRIGNKGYKLPANIDGVRNVLYKNKTSKVNGNRERDSQAYRVAWRIILDWILSQFSIIASGQAQPEEVLLPYLWNGKETFYDAYKKGKLQLPEGTE